MSATSGPTSAWLTTTRRLQDPGYALDHAGDHAATVSVYLEDPDGNGVELPYDRPREAWFDGAGSRS